MSSTTTMALSSSFLVSSSSSADMLNVSPKMMIPIMKAPSQNRNTHAGSNISCSSSLWNKQQQRRKRMTMICPCEVALKSSVDQEEETSSSSSSAPKSTLESDEGNEKAKIGAKVRVKVPLKVHHVPRVPEVDLTGMEGTLKLYVGMWKGKRISANFPYKIEFYTNVEGRGPVKFFAHLKEDEFEYID